MNAVEIEEAISLLAEQAFNPADFPFAFLEAFGNKKTTIDKLKKGSSNASDIKGGVLQRNHIHILVCAKGQVSDSLIALKESAATKTARNKVKFILATDGIDFEAEDLISGDLIACDYPSFPNYFGFFLALANITTLPQIRENAFDIKATGRLNRLYVELLKDNPDWGSVARRHDLNHFMARLIFCFFAEDTDIFNGDNLFTATINQMSARDASNTHQVIGELFRAMNTRLEDRAAVQIKSWADGFPYVNGGLFSDGNDVPQFSKIARSYLLHIGNLDWKQINPDIFGSMIQAVADEGERSALGMHYTSVPNILKVLNPLFLDDLRAQFAAAGDSHPKLQKLRDRLSKIRVFDPACGSGNFLVIAYKQMRQIEAEINQRCRDAHRRSNIPLTNFRGIELRDFSAEIARLALIIAEYQCDVLYRGQKEALAEFLPLNAQNWIICGNALRLDWLAICPPTWQKAQVRSEDLLSMPENQADIAFENEGGETYICGNPPYIGSTWQSKVQKSDLKAIFADRVKSWKSLDYVAGWFMKAADYGQHTKSSAAFVSTNSICQGQQVPILWPAIFATGHDIAFAHTSFKWANLASHNAGVTVAIVGISNHVGAARKLFSLNEGGETDIKEVPHINAYLVAASHVIVEKAAKPLTEVSPMSFGNKPVDGGNLLLSAADLSDLGLSNDQRTRFIRRIYGSAEFIKGLQRYCLWIEDDMLAEALTIPTLKDRIERVRQMRLSSRDKSANEMAKRPHQMREMNIGRQHTIVIPRVSSENREYLPVGIVSGGVVIGDRNFALYDAPLWNMALIASRLHWVWIGTVCARMRTDFSYSNTLGWNSFPMPKMTAKNKQDLTRCAEDILLAREAHFPKTIADLYDPEKMPDNLRHAHDRNDEVLERIYIGRRFKNDTERLEKLFDLYTKMTVKKNKKKVSRS